MALAPEVEARIRELGGTIAAVPVSLGGSISDADTGAPPNLNPNPSPNGLDADTDLEARLRTVSFPRALLFEGFIDHAERDVLVRVVTEAQTSGSGAAALITYPTLEWDVSRFTPFTPGTADYDEWDGTIDDQALRAAVSSAPSAPSASAVSSPPDAETPLEIVFIGYSEGWPNNYFVLASDPDPNPAVYTTDHEVYFSEVEYRGTLLNLLRDTLSDGEVVRVAQERCAKLGLIPTENGRGTARGRGSEGASGT
jgi:hypothetical protein